MANTITEPAIRASRRPIFQPSDAQDQCKTASTVSLVRAKHRKS